MRRDTDAARPAEQRPNDVGHADAPHVEALNGSVPTRPESGAPWMPKTPRRRARLAWQSGRAPTTPTDAGNDARATHLAMSTLARPTLGR
jgi:hypothetical protein